MSAGAERDRPAIVVVAGPTASGKSALALALAERTGGEIVNADSRQIYRGMDIGTAKPTPVERARVPHHLIDIRDPDEPFALAEFLALAHEAIADIAARGRRAFVVGGTGQYVRALLQGWQAPAVPPDAAFRAALEERAVQEGPEALHRRLAVVDPEAARTIDHRNVRRVIRALEVIRATGQPFSAQRGRTPPPYRALVLAIRMERVRLYARIDRRVAAMFAAGLVDEVRGLVAAGYPCALPAMQSIGYVQVCGYLNGDLTLAEAVERTRTGTHRLARSQGAWFRAGDPAITWLDAELTDGDDAPPVAAALAHVASFFDG